ncbi:hypothetical protein [Legionella bononiensis]|uniref:Oxidoreductase n=1 Tax=Legionella bononiensis TaxID=2793102 RepID=A0ABS1WC17_9GAMM|nr:hypothetical protein [Legionella bononiensis]MBL7481191.1 hypothetical protein [Legionella bononiensis]MBL7526900.1 hypothetical protein [Legionella bononiensis]MBL7563814.1 hypothetical protein [Legionella bononiensis]
MYNPMIHASKTGKTYPSTTVQFSVINKIHPIDFKGIIGIYVCNSQLSIYIETKNKINAYTINPDKNNIGHWHSETLPRNADTADTFDLLRETSEHYAELSEPLTNLEPFKEIMNQETLVGFSTLKDINETIQLALSVLNNHITFEYKPTP